MWNLWEMLQNESVSKVITANETWAYGYYLETAVSLVKESILIVSNKRLASEE